MTTNPQSSPPAAAKCRTTKPCQRGSETTGSGVVACGHGDHRAAQNLRDNTPSAHPVAAGPERVGSYCFTDEMVEWTPGDIKDYYLLLREQTLELFVEWILDAIIAFAFETDRSPLRERRGFPGRGPIPPPSPSATLLSPGVPTRWDERRTGTSKSKPNE